MVDDEAGIVDAIERMFRTKYNVLKATSATEGLKILDQHPEPISVIITDQRMPNMTGVEFLSKTLATRPDTTRILLTGYTDVQSVIGAINSGQVYRYITKPWDTVDLVTTVDRGIERFALSQELKEKNQALAEALNELKTLDKAKNDFMILINHELKTPLTAILSFTELLKEGRLDDEQSLCVNRIYKSGMRLKHLIDDSLTVISAETKTLKVKSKPFSCTELGGKLNSDVLSELIRKNQKLDLVWIEKKVIGDLDMISGALSRLLHNAAKFGQEGSVILLHAFLTSPHRVRFSVSNHGSAIPIDLIEKIFNPFFIDENVMNHSAGMGLGLAVCQSILKAHQSRLKIENTQFGVEVSFELACL